MKKKSDNAVSVPIPKEDGHEIPFRFGVSPRDIGLESILTGEVVGRGIIVRVGPQLRIRAKVEAELALACDRCLTAVGKEVLEEIDLVVKVSIGPEIIDENSEDQLTIGTDSSALSLESEVREVLRLAVPMKCLCTEACKGICETCGTNLNVAECACESENFDPRWSALKELRSRD